VTRRRGDREAIITWEPFEIEQRQEIVGRGWNMPTFIKGNIKEGAFSGQADNNSSSAFDY
jgi:hypothetical protein